MANKQISDLTEATEVQSGDLFVLERTGTAYKVDGKNLGGVFTITCEPLTTIDSTHYSSTCDATATQIETALNAGKVPIIKAEFLNSVLTGQIQSIDYVGGNPTYAWFCCVVYMSGIVHGYISVNNNGDVDITLY